jgi:hypothetical protein
MLRGVCKSKDLYELFKLFSSRCFREDAFNLLTHGIMYELYSIFLYVMSNQMVLRVDVLGLNMEYRILGQDDCISLVNQKWTSIHLFLLQIL